MIIRYSGPLGELAEVGLGFGFSRLLGFRVFKGLRKTLGCRVTLVVRSKTEL